MHDEQRRGAAASVKSDGGSNHRARGGWGEGCILAPVCGARRRFSHLRHAGAGRAVLWTDIRMDIGLGMHVRMMRTKPCTHVERGPPAIPARASTFSVGSTIAHLRLGTCGMMSGFMVGSSTCSRLVLSAAKNCCLVCPECGETRARLRGADCAVSAWREGRARESIASLDMRRHAPKGEKLLVALRHCTWKRRFDPACRPQHCIRLRRRKRWCTQAWPWTRRGAGHRA